MSVFCVCVPYFSLPEFPKSCALVRNKEILPRDVLLCNKTNAGHIEGGIQYDPNIENGEYRICEPPVRRSLKRKAKDFDELYLIFRTRFIRLNGTSLYLVPGFYTIKKEFHKDEREGPVILAETMKFVSIQDAVDISRQMEESRAFRASFSSQNTSWSKRLVKWIEHLRSRKDQTTAYIDEIVRLKKAFKENEFGDSHYPVCDNCTHGQAACSSCPLVWRRNTFKQIPQNPAHYMKNLDEFYAEMCSKP